MTSIMTADHGSILYFAYGSNMHTQRLKERVPSADPIKNIQLNHHTLAWDKKSFNDGSGKCHILNTGKKKDTVWGVLYRMKPSEKHTLDSIEGKGYYSQKIVLESEENSIEAYTYFASAVKEGLRPYHWYKKIVLKGAQQHQLPADYIKKIESVTTDYDKDKKRIKSISHLIC